VDVLNLLLLKSLRIMGTRIRFQGFGNLPVDRPLIIVSNHQSPFDIPPVVWGFRQHHPKFISKIELAKNIPSISYNLKHSDSALIDRKNRKQAIQEINRLGELIEKNNFAACIYPEGTRSTNGKLKRFKEGGIATLLQASPSALIVPFVINGNHRLLSSGSFPMSFGQSVTYQVLDPIEPNGLSSEELVGKVEQQIRIALGQN
jgi:1-acyl-sn-glycerol-3-phosphate acyltransferase